MGKAKKFYVVWNGRNPGIFDTWAECEKQVKGFEAARYKSFESEKEAIEAFGAGAPSFKGTAKKNHKPALFNHVPIKDSIAVDAACSGNPGILEYQGVQTATGKTLFHVGPFPQGTVNIGEFLAIVHGLGFLKQKQLNLPVYSDSKTAIKWVRDKKANTRLQPNATNAELMQLIQRAENWLKNNTWENPVLKWDTAAWGEIPADFGRK
ncbi:MAG: ribonuclease H family protein [Lentimicrobiaceae bacterium]|nr:ribonuclease H family protein [Lentimicrobiaceae bacterium]